MFNLKNTLCRTCLESVPESNGFNIFITADLTKKFISCTGQPVETTDEYPHQICQKCYENIAMFYEFQQMCYKSLKKFLVLLKTEHESEEIDRINKNFTSENRKQDQNLAKSKQLYVTSIEDSDKSQFLFIKNLEKEKGYSKLRPELEDEKLSRNAKTKRANLSVRRKNCKSTVSKDKTKHDLKEYLQFDKGVKAKEDIQNSLAFQQSSKEQDETNLVFEDDSPTDVVISEEQENEQQQTEKLILTHTPENEPGTEFTSLDKQEHQCPRCSLKCKTTFKLQVHLRQHDGLPPYVCNVKGCTSCFDRWHSYKEHQKVHSGREQRFKCDIDNCERMYKNKSNLNIHKRKFHNFGPELKKHMCEICGKVFKASAVLNDHRFTHIDKTQLPYACEEVDCGKRYSTKEKLKVHKMRHAGIKNFVCPHCGMRKTTRNELKIHINYHTLERTWSCRFCPKVCNSAGNLKMHIKTIHEGAKDFACRFCQRTFAKADTKKYHEMTHTGEKPNECKECGRRFVQPAALRTHRKIHLREKEKLLDKQKCKTAIVKEATSCVAGNMEETNLLTEYMAAEVVNDTTES